MLENVHWIGAPVLHRNSPPFGLFIVMMLATLGGCAVGPRFAPPSPPPVSAYTRAADAPKLAAGTGEVTQRLLAGAEARVDWWREFHSNALDRMVREALAHNPSIAAAQATLAGAQQAVIEARGGYYPQVDLTATAERQKGPAFALGLLPARQSLPQFNLYSVGPTVSFEPDVFGLTARRVEERQALADVRRDELAAAKLSIAGNTVVATLNVAALNVQIKAVRLIVAEDTQNLSLVRRKVRAGRGRQVDVLSARARLANDATELPVLGRQLAAAEDRLAVLQGAFPAGWTPPDIDLDDLALPARLPVAVPSALLLARPDIRAAESLLHASSAAVGVATARLYPNILLSASVATAGLTTGSLFGPNSGVWALAGAVTAPVFHGRALAAQRREARAQMQQELALYRRTVLEAFGQVADTLRALGEDAALVEAEHQALDAAARALKLQRASYVAGRSDLLRLLDAEREFQQARLGYARASAQRFVDSAQLFVAMGGAR